MDICPVSLCRVVITPVIWTLLRHRENVVSAPLCDGLCVGLCVATCFSPGLVRLCSHVLCIGRPIRTVCMYVVRRYMYVTVHKFESFMRRYLGHPRALGAPVYRQIPVFPCSLAMPAVPALPRSRIDIHIGTESTAGVRGSRRR